MATTSALPEWVPTDEQGLQDVLCGTWFDAVRVPGPLVDGTIVGLIPGCGPLILSVPDAAAYWLVVPGAADGWGPLDWAGVRVLGEGETLAVPPASWHTGPGGSARPTRWFFRPRGDCLTDPTHLHRVLRLVASVTRQAADHA